MQFQGGWKINMVNFLHYVHYLSIRLDSYYTCVQPKRYMHAPQWVSNSHFAFFISPQKIEQHHAVSIPLLPPKSKQNGTVSTKIVYYISLEVNWNTKTQFTATNSLAGVDLPIFITKRKVFWFVLLQSTLWISNEVRKNPFKQNRKLTYESFYPYNTQVTCCGFKIRT